MPNRDRDLLIAILHEDFLAFVTRAFDEVEPRVNLAVENYIRLLAHELTALAAGDTKRLVISAPPRHMKSLLTSVFLPAWMLGRDPRLRFIIVSHQMDLATLFSRLIRQIAASDWYAEVFPRTRLSPDHNTASEFITTVGGSVRTDLTRELSEKIAIREGERCLNVSKQRALLKSVVAKAFKGDIRAASLVFQLMAKFVVLEEVASKRERDLLSDEEAAILERFIAKRTAGQK
jgi:hypothetical protein